MIRTFSGGIIEQSAHDQTFILLRSNKKILISFCLSIEANRTVIRDEGSQLFRSRCRQLSHIPQSPNYNFRWKDSETGRHEKCPNDNSPNGPLKGLGSILKTEGHRAFGFGQVRLVRLGWFG